MMSRGVGAAGFRVACLLSAFRLAAAEPELCPEDLPHFPPLEPPAALESFVVRPGFRVELAAHEPEVMDPIALSFDERGRIYVVEMRDYSERRPERLGRVRRLEDRDGDGRYEASLPFLEGLPWPTAVACWQGGVFVAATPDLIYARDTDGDGRADIREVVLTGFASDFAPYATNQLNVQAMVNSLQWGLDCRFHGSSSLSGGKVRIPDTPFTRRWRATALGEPAAADPEAARVIDLRGRDFSFDPRTLQPRAETGGGQYGMSFDDTGRKFLCSNSDHLQWVRYEERYAARNPDHPLPAARISIAADGPAAEVFRISPEEPWRVIRTRWRVTGLVAGLIEGGGRSSGYFTSATGLTVYRGDAFGPEFAGDVFVADCGSNLIHRKKLRAIGCELVGERPADEAKREFLASHDTWFRPVQFANAPDGCLWMIDMYREVIEHPWSIPPNLKRLLDLNAGNDRGRLYRIAPTHGALRRSVDLASAGVRELVAALEHPNGWHRDTASRLLCERRDPASLPLLRQTLRESTSPLARLHALHVLDGLDGLEGSDPASVEPALGDPSPDVRRHAIRLLESRWNDRELPPSVARRFETLVADQPSVRLQLALSLGMVRHPRHAELVTRLLRSADGREGERLIQEAALAATDDAILPVFHALAADRLAAGVSPALAQLAETLGSRHRPNETEAVVNLIAALDDQRLALRLATRLADGLALARASVAQADPGHRLDPLLAFAQSVATRPPSDPDAGGREIQLDAIRWLAHQTPDRSRPALLAVLDTPPAGPVQRAAVDGLLRAEDSGAWREIVSRWPRLTTEARQAALESVLRRPSGTGWVLDALSGKEIPPQDLPAAQLTALRGHPDASLRRRAIELLGAPMASRDQAVTAVLPALNLKGSGARGREVFRAQCAPCHRLAGEGFALGPDLESVRSQPKDKLVVAIVDPNREVAPSYLATTVETRDGESYTGMQVTDDASGILLRQASGLETRLARDQIQSSRTDGRSVMPEGFETTLTPQQLADLLACLVGDP